MTDKKCFKNAFSKYIIFWSHNLSGLDFLSKNMISFQINFEKPLRTYSSVQKNRSSNSIYHFQLMFCCRKVLHVTFSCLFTFLTRITNTWLICIYRTEKITQKSFIHLLIVIQCIKNFHQYSGSRTIRSTSDLNVRMVSVWSCVDQVSALMVSVRLTDTNGQYLHRYGCNAIV